MKRHVPRFSKLRSPYVKDSQTEVDILSVQTEGFVHAHPSYRQQTKKSCKRTSAQSLGRWELLCLAKDLLDLSIGIDVRSLASITMRENAYRWNLSLRVRGAEPDGEASHHAQTPSPGGRLRLLGLCCPAKRQFGGDIRSTFGLQKRNKIL